MVRFLFWKNSFSVPQWFSGKESACNAGDTRDRGLIPRWGRSPGRGHSNPLQYFCQEDPMGRGAWWDPLHRVAKSWTGLKRLSMYARLVTAELQIIPILSSFKQPLFYYIVLLHQVSFGQFFDSTCLLLGNQLICSHMCGTLVWMPGLSSFSIWSEPLHMFVSTE